MKRYLFFSLILLASLGYARGQSPRIGEIEFFGYAGADLEKIRAALPFREGEEISRETWPEKKERAQRAVKQATGNAPTEVAAICCDARGNLSIFIGLSGSPVRYLPAQRGAVRLPSKIMKLYAQSLGALDEATRRGIVTEDSANGYSLSAYAPLRALQLKMRAYALHHAGLLREVLASSADARARAVAAELLGYARQSGAQLKALARASRDRDGDVRNNATRALLILTEANPALAGRIPPASFLEMLLSGTWTDVNKGSGLLSNLTKSREPGLLAQLHRREVMERLFEVARWRTGHANPARYILGRMAGIEEKRLQQLVASGQSDAIMEALRGVR
jgi:hypothetical protein